MTGQLDKVCKAYLNFTLNKIKMNDFKLGTSKWFLVTLIILSGEKSHVLWHLSSPALVRLHEAVRREN